MGSTSLESILSEIVAILDSHGHSVEANWISERRDAIERDVSAGSQGALQVALDELHSIVLGYGRLVRSDPGAHRGWRCCGGPSEAGQAFRSTLRTDAAGLSKLERRVSWRPLAQRADAEPSDPLTVIELPWS